LFAVYSIAVITAFNVIFTSGMEVKHMSRFGVRNMRQIWEQHERSKASLGADVDIFALDYNNKWFDATGTVLSVDELFVTLGNRADSKIIDIQREIIESIEVIK